MSPGQALKPDLTRRDFIEGGSSTLLALLGGIELRAADSSTPPPPSASTPPTGVGVIGLGPWGREILSTLARLPQAAVRTICDSYPAALKRAANLAPGATGVADCRQVLDDPAIGAVVVATPTHAHREIALAALQAGKHVYCEVPLAHTADDARAIARAARATPRLVFQPGLQERSDPQRVFVASLFRSRILGQVILARSQWHKKTSWRLAASNPERETQINWRLDRALSLGLPGEVGLHQLDSALWFLNERPLAVTGAGSLLLWKEDGRSIPDTVDTTLEFPGAVRFTQSCTLASSFDGDHELYFGTDATVLLRGSRAWMFREADAPLLGWEAQARKDPFFQDTGLVLLANASKAKNPADPADPALATTPPLQAAFEAFFRNCADLSGAVADFTASYGSADPQALTAYLATLPRQPAATWTEGLAATLLAIQAKDALLGNRRLELSPGTLELG